jgi:hypothetical protein
MNEYAHTGSKSVGSGSAKRVTIILDLVPITKATKILEGAEDGSSGSLL